MAHMLLKIIHRNFRIWFDCFWAYRACSSCTNIYPFSPIQVSNEYSRQLWSAVPSCLVFSTNIISIINFYLKYEIRYCFWPAVFRLLKINALLQSWYLLVVTLYIVLHSAIHRNLFFQTTTVHYSYSKLDMVFVRI